MAPTERAEPPMAVPRRDKSAHWQNPPLGLHSEPFASFSFKIDDAAQVQTSATFEKPDVLATAAA